MKRMNEKETTAELRTVERWASLYGTADWARNAAMMLKKWPLETMVSEADFVAAVKAATQVGMK